MKKDNWGKVIGLARVLMWMLVIGIASTGQVVGQEQVADTVEVSQDTSQQVLDSLFLDSLVRELPILDSIITTPVVQDSDTLGQPVVQQTIQWSDTSVYRLLQRLEELSSTLIEANRTIRQGFDTTRMSIRLPKMRRDLQLIEENLNSYGNRMNLRNLNAMIVVLTEMERQLSRWEKELLEYNKVLVTMSQRIEGFLNDPTFRTLPSDTVLLSLYIQQLRDLSTKWSEAITNQREGLINIGMLHNRVTGLNIQVNGTTEEVNNLVRTYDEKILQRGYGFIWEPPDTSDKMSILSVSKHSGQDLANVLGYFLASNWWPRVFNVGLIILMFILIKVGQKHLKNSPNREEHLRELKYLHKHPVVAALVIGLTTAPFLYANPPLFYIEVLWGIQVFLLTFLIWDRANRTERIIWLVALVIFIIYGVFNLLVETTTEERWTVLFLGIAAAAVGLGLVRYANSGPDLFPPVMQGVIWLFFLLSLASVILNIGGWFQLAKMLGGAALFGMFYAINLWVFIDMITELIFLQSLVYKDNRQLSGWIDFKDLQQRMRKALIVLAGFLWLVSFSRNLNFYEFFYDGIANFLEKERHVGNATFTFGSLLVFGIILWLTALISRVLSYFFGTADEVITSGKKNRLGNYMLIFRLLILTLGFFFALSAAGIPLDKVAIVIGALGVGIGFGLQNIVNNLISGIILAFERPIQIGDTIELGTKIGTVKEIGIRASKIATFDGADLVVPNGDLISQQLINWTLSNNDRRIELIVGVGYGSDILQVKELITKILKELPSVMVNPAPMVLMHDLSNSSVDFRVLFWTFDFSNWLNVKSEVLAIIYQQLRENGIEIPFPKRDIFVHFPDGQQPKVKELEKPPKEEEEEGGHEES